jgi:hypothetical protein
MSPDTLFCRLRNRLANKRAQRKVLDFSVLAVGIDVLLEGASECDAHRGLRRPDLDKYTIS